MSRTFNFSSINWEIWLIFCKFYLLSHDIINRWVYPLVPDMGICSLSQNYMFLRNNVYRSKSVQFNAIARQNVVLHENCQVAEGTELINAVIGQNCKIGRNCVLENAFVFDNVKIGEKCVLKNCVIGKNTEIKNRTAINNGSVIGSNCVIPEEQVIDKAFIVEKKGTDEFDDAAYQKIGEKAFRMQINDGGRERKPSGGGGDSDDESACFELENLHMTDVVYKYESSIYSSSSDGSESNRLTPIPDDANSKFNRFTNCAERNERTLRNCVNI